MKRIIGVTVLVLAMPSVALAQAQPADKAMPGSQSEMDSQARTVPGTVTSPNPNNAAIAKIEAAGKNPNSGPPNAHVHEPGGPGTAENNNGGR